MSHGDDAMSAARSRIAARPRAPRWLALLGFAVGMVGVACGALDVIEAEPAPTLPSRPSAEPRAPSGSDAGAPREAGAKPVPKEAPVLRALALRCKLINGAFLDDPTPNAAHLRANVRGTDLGIPVAHDGSLYFFFGDTAGAKGIWPLGGESLPDAVGVISHSAAKASATALCDQLRFLGGPQEASVGRRADARIERDFAAGAMTPPQGRSIAEYIRNPAGPRGANAFPYLPGDFEVPSGAFSYGGSIYVFYTTVESPTVVEMKASYLATWVAPSPSGPPDYRILYGLDERFDGNGALRGDFVNVAPVVSGDEVLLFGTGKYRESAVHLARKKLATLATEGGLERFDAMTRTWRRATDASARPIVNARAGELSVRFFPELGWWVMTTQEISGGENRLVARFSDVPEGPWSAPRVIASMSDPAFRAKHCCTSSGCAGERLLHCDRAGFYAPYMLPDARPSADGSFAIDFVVSTWDPYNVALLTATFGPL